ncbi:hypothetical protein ACFSM5_16495 [Lacibacterium aquatile]|uniref:Uncharacterized protein n=1 Tax=Lacibacterium aquatile TaxID=1168082 RepID=A0ABW5DVL7_9PROT
MSETTTSPQKSEAGEEQRVAICATVDDLYQPPSRGMIGTLSRSFLDQLVLTPTELLHSSRHQLRLESAGTLMRDIMERAAVAQGRALGMPTRDRARDLQKLLDEGGTFIREVEKGEPPAELSAGKFAASVQRLSSGVSADKASMRINRMLTEYLITCRTWVDKLDKVMALAQEVGNGPDLKWIDALLAELLISDMGQDTIFGRRLSLEDRIDDLIDTLKQQYPSRDKIGEPLPMAATFQKLMLALDLPETKAALEVAIVQTLASRNPLAAADMVHELKATHGILMRLRMGERILGGRRSLEYVDKRMQRILTEENVADYIRSASTLGDRILAVLELYSVTFGPRNKRLLEGHLQRYFADEDFHRRLLVGEGTGVHKVRLVTNLYQAIVAAPLERGMKVELAGRMAQVQADYIVESKFFANLDKQFPTVARKAMALIDLVREGIFIPGDNVERAKLVVKHYLNKPDFIDKFLEGIPAAPARDAHLAQLRQKLGELDIPMPAKR